MYSNVDVCILKLMCLSCNGTSCDESNVSCNNIDAPKICKTDKISAQTINNGN